MSQNLKTTIIQTNLFWQDREANINMFEEKIMSLKENTDLIVLPEMFTTGFTMDAENNAEHCINELQFVPTVKKMQEWSKNKDSAICGSLIVEEKGIYYNRLYFVKPDGSYQYYDKRHLFRMAGEAEHYSAGSEKVIIEYKGWKIKPLICYDLRFPIWSRNVNNEYDLLIYVANWPAPRSTAWQTLLKARAAENLAYCIGVNRVGKDENDFHYSGNSAIIDFKGETVFENENDEVSHTETLSKRDLDSYRKRFPAHLDADTFDIKKVPTRF